MVTNIDASASNSWVSGRSPVLRRPTRLDTTWRWDSEGHLSHHGRVWKRLLPRSSPQTAARWSFLDFVGSARRALRARKRRPGSVAFHRSRHKRSRRVRTVDHRPSASQPAVSFTMTARARRSTTRITSGIQGVHRLRGARSLPSGCAKCFAELLLPAQSGPPESAGADVHRRMRCAPGPRPWHWNRLVASLNRGSACATRTRGSPAPPAARGALRAPNAAGCAGASLFRCCRVARFVGVGRRAVFS